MVIFARGTNDAPGLGNPGQAFTDALSTMVGGRTLTSYAVNYPASYDFLQAADGAADATNYISALTQQCPSTRILLMSAYAVSEMAATGRAFIDKPFTIRGLTDKVRQLLDQPSALTAGA